MTNNRCDACGTSLFIMRNKLKVGKYEYCGPHGSGCHKLGMRNMKWSLTPAEAAQMFDDYFGEAS